MAEVRKDTYQIVTDAIITALEHGTRPWQRPWATAGAMFTLPRRSTGEVYRGINILLLWAAIAEQGFEYDRFMTYKQAQELGGNVRKGEKGTMIVKYGTFGREVENERGEREEAQIPYLKGYTVFNVSQIDGLADEYYIKPQIVEPQNTMVRNERVDNFVANLGANIKHGGDRAYYQPFLDRITMPKPECFVDSESYYSTLLHELAHWTGNASRLDRDQSGAFGSEDYAFEELIAEITSAFACIELGVVDASREENASYVGSWLKKLRGDKRYIFKAAAKAQAAMDYLQAQQEEKRAAA